MTKGRKTRKNSVKKPSRSRPGPSSKDKDDDFGISALKSYLASLNLCIKDTLGDGNCLFRALADQMHGSDEEHRSLRLATVEYMERNEDHFKWFVEDDVPFDKHCSLMAQDGTFGGNLELVAFARLQDVDVKVYQSTGDVFVISGCTDEKKKVPTDDENGDLGVETKQETKKRKKKKDNVRQDPQPKEKNQVHDKEVVVRRTLHVAYHSWEHYSSIRNADGPFTGLPCIRVAMEPPPNPCRSRIEGVAGPSNKCDDNLDLKVDTDIQPDDIGTPESTAKELAVLSITQTNDVPSNRKSFEPCEGDANTVPEAVGVHDIDERRKDVRAESIQTSGVSGSSTNQDQKSEEHNTSSNKFNPCEEGSNKENSETLPELDGEKETPSVTSKAKAKQRPSARERKELAKRRQKERRKIKHKSKMDGLNVTPIDVKKEEPTDLSFRQLYI